MSVPKEKSTRHSFRKGSARPYHRTRRTPALSTQEAAQLIIGIIEARLQEGWNLDQIGWQRYCRDQAVIQVVIQQLEPDTPIQKEMSP
jgi:hypothetical protein